MQTLSLLNLRMTASGISACKHPVVIMLALGCCGAMGIFPKVATAQQKNPIVADLFDRSAFEPQAQILIPSHSPASSAAELFERPLTELPSLAPDSGYRLGPGDEIELSVLGYPEFASRQIVLPDGTISVPLLGSIFVKNFTLATLNQQLTQSLRSYLVNPVVNLSLQSLRSLRIDVSGEVARPGPIQLSGLTTGAERPSLTNALLAAGGITSYANLQALTIYRTVATGEQETIAVDLWDAINSTKPAQEMLLQDGDAVWVPRLEPMADLDRRLLARSSLSPATIQVRIVGEVDNPGAIQVPPDSVVSDVVASAGGPTNDARLSDVAVVRAAPDGTAQAKPVNIQGYSDSYQVQDGDIIIVSKRAFPRVLDSINRVLGTLLQPINSLLFIESLFNQ